MKNSKSKWECKFKCDLSRGACEHLELMLPSMDQGLFVTKDQGSHHLVYTDTIERYPETFEDDIHFAQIDSYIKQFTSLDKLEIQLLTKVMRQGRKNIPEVAEEMFISRAAAYKLFKRVLAKCKTELESRGNK